LSFVFSLIKLNLPKFKIKVMFQNIITWIVETISVLGYPGIVILMFLESSFVPFPSEIVIIPAGYLVFQGEMSFSLVILWGIVGSLSGAIFNYYLAMYLGRPLLHKYQKWFFLNEQRLNKIEYYFKTHGHISTFVGRLLPGIRQYISFPAGLAHMSFCKFSFFTALGAGIWVFILAYIGYEVGGNQDLISEYLNKTVFWIILGLGILVLVYLCVHFYRKRQVRKLTIDV